jgi:hypothetical protein
VKAASVSARKTAANAQAKNRIIRSGTNPCFQGKAPQTFVERVDREAPFRGFECMASVSSIEPGTTDALEELSVRAAEAPDVAFRPDSWAAARRVSHGSPLPWRATN